MLIEKIGDAELHWDGDNLFVFMSKNADGVLRKVSRVAAEFARAKAPMGKRFYTSTAGKYGYVKTWKHRDPGKLKRNIMAKKSKFKGGGWIVLVHERAFYARWVEYKRPKDSEIGRFGQKVGKTPARPFLTPALRKAQKLIDTEIRRGIIPSGVSALPIATL